MAHEAEPLIGAKTKRKQRGKVVYYYAKRKASPAHYQSTAPMSPIPEQQRQEPNHPPSTTTLVANPLQPRPQPLRRRQAEKQATGKAPLVVTLLLLFLIVAVYLCSDYLNVDFPCQWPGARDKPQTSYTQVNWHAAVGLQLPLISSSSKHNKSSNSNSDSSRTTDTSTSTSTIESASSGITDPNFSGTTDPNSTSSGTADSTDSTYDSTDDFTATDSSIYGSNMIKVKPTDQIKTFFQTWQAGRCRDIKSLASSDFEFHITGIGNEDNDEPVVLNLEDFTDSYCPTIGGKFVMEFDEEPHSNMGSQFGTLRGFGSNYFYKDNGAEGPCLLPFYVTLVAELDYRGRIQILRELVHNAKEYDSATKECTRRGFLEQAASTTGHLRHRRLYQEHKVPEDDLLGSLNKIAPSALSSFIPSASPIGSPSEGSIGSPSEGLGDLDTPNVDRSLLGFPEDDDWGSDPWGSDQWTSPGDYQSGRAPDNDNTLNIAKKIVASMSAGKCDHMALYLAPSFSFTLVSTLGDNILDVNGLINKCNQDNNNEPFAFYPLVETGDEHSVTLAGPALKLQTTQLGEPCPNFASGSLVFTFEKSMWGTIKVASMNMMIDQPFSKRYEKCHTMSTHIQDSTFSPVQSIVLPGMTAYSLNGLDPTYLIFFLLCLALLVLISCQLCLLIKKKVEPYDRPYPDGTVVSLETGDDLIQWTREPDTFAPDPPSGPPTMKSRKMVIKSRGGREPEPGFHGSHMQYKMLVNSRDARETDPGYATPSTQSTPSTPSTVDHVNTSSTMNRPPTIDHFYAMNRPSLDHVQSMDMSPQMPWTPRAEDMPWMLQQLAMNSEPRTVMNAGNRTASDMEPRTAMSAEQPRSATSAEQPRSAMMTEARTALINRDRTAMDTGPQGQDMVFQPPNAEPRNEAMRYNPVSPKPPTHDDMLYELFPSHIAEQLKAGKKVEPESHELVTIVFSDIKGFTDTCREISPLKVSMMLDRLYLAFDRIARKHHVFKVETIGDAYMGVTNLVENQETDHVKRIAEFAVDMICEANQILIDEEEPDKGYVRIRVGFHSGPVVSGVIGSLNKRYGLFGDTVNTASRMESNSFGSRILCSESACMLLKQQAPDFPVVSRGKIPIKGKGKMQVFWVGDELISNNRRKNRLTALAKIRASTTGGLLPAPGVSMEMSESQADDTEDGRAMFLGTRSNDRLMDSADFMENSESQADETEGDGRWLLEPSPMRGRLMGRSRDYREMDMSGQADETEGDGRFQVRASTGRYRHVEPAWRKGGTTTSLSKYLSRAKSKNARRFEPEEEEVDISGSQADDSYDGHMLTASNARTAKAANMHRRGPPVHLEEEESVGQVDETEEGMFFESRTKAARNGYRSPKATNNRRPRSPPLMNSQEESQADDSYDRRMLTSSVRTVKASNQQYGNRHVRRHGPPINFEEDESEGMGFDSKPARNGNRSPKATKKRGKTPPKKRRQKSVTLVEPPRELLGYEDMSDRYADDSEEEIPFESRRKTVKTSNQKGNRPRIPPRKFEKKPVNVRKAVPKPKQEKQTYDQYKKKTPKSPRRGSMKDKISMFEDQSFSDFNGMFNQDDDADSASLLSESSHKSLREQVVDDLLGIRPGEKGAMDASESKVDDLLGRRAGRRPSESSTKSARSAAGSVKSARSAAGSVKSARSAAGSVKKANPPEAEDAAAKSETPTEEVQPDEPKAQEEPETKEPESKEEPETKQEPEFKQEPETKEETKKSSLQAQAASEGLEVTSDEKEAEDD